MSPAAIGRETESIKADNGELLLTWIGCPYARHSSFEELWNFVKAFKPEDISQCVLNEETWTPEPAMKDLDQFLIAQGSTRWKDQHYRKTIVSVTGVPGHA
jgi:hypothetical protein